MAAAVSAASGLAAAETAAMTVGWTEGRVGANGSGPEVGGSIIVTK